MHGKHYLETKKKKITRTMYYEGFRAFLDTKPLKKRMNSYVYGER